MLDDWDAARAKFVKVFPNEYRRALDRDARERATAAQATAARRSTPADSDDGRRP